MPSGMLQVRFRSDVVKILLDISQENTVSKGESCLWAIVRYSRKRDKRDELLSREGNELHSLRSNKNLHSKYGMIVITTHNLQYSSIYSVSQSHLVGLD